METKAKKILVVDDAPEIVNTLKRFLSNKGYEVMAAYNGEEALSILEREKAELILLDIMMPGIKGTEVARIIKAKYPTVKLVVLTGHQAEVDNFLKDNILKAVFTKPVKLQDLYDKLVELLDEEKQPLKIEPKQGVKARILLINAKILFIEPSPDIYGFLAEKFNGLSAKGENYTLACVGSEEALRSEITAFNPDVCVINASFFKTHSTKILSKISEANLKAGDVIVYNIDNVSSIQQTELARLIKAVEMTCFKNGLIDIKWLEI